MSGKFGGNELGWLDWAVSQSAVSTALRDISAFKPPVQSSPLPPVSTPGEAAAVCSSLSLPSNNHDAIRVSGIASNKVAARERKIHFYFKTLFIIIINQTLLYSGKKMLRIFWS